MKLNALAVAVVIASSTALAADPVVPSFESEPLSFVPTPLSESSPSELRELLAVPTPWRKLVVDLRPHTPVKSVAHLSIIGPNPDLHYAMPILTPNPDVDYKLHLIQPETAAEDGK